MIKTLVLLIALAPGLMRAERKAFNLNAVDGFAMLDEGKDVEAIKHFKQQMEDQWDKGNEPLEMACPFCNLGIAIGEYHLKNYEESKRYILNMMNMKERYYSSCPLVLSYAFLVASKSRDKSFYNQAILNKMNVDKSGWKQRDLDDLEMCHRHAKKIFEPK